MTKGKLKKIKLFQGMLLLFLVFVGVFGLNNFAYADIATVAVNVAKVAAASSILIPLGTVTALIVVVVGILNSLIMGIIAGIAPYNNFINETSVINAWVIVRDLCNMFFILILLAIAFGTILRQESYSVKKLLPKVLIMAVLINFSKMFFGVIIDFSQVIMLTFIKAWGNAGSFVYITQMTDYFKISDYFKFEDTKPLQLTGIIASMIVAIIFMLVSGVVLVVVMSVLVVRIVMIWIYVILSPLVFLGWAFPALQKYTNKIWEDFIKNVMIGPILAFFVWLSIMMVDGGAKNVASATAKEQCFGITDILCLNSTIPLILSLGMLMGGLMVAQQAGGAAGSIAGKGMDWAKKVGTAPGKAASWAGKGAILAGGRKLDEGQMWLQKKAGVENPRTLNYRNIATGWKASRDEALEKYDQKVGRGNVWRDTFDKHMELRQYGAMRKSTKQIADDSKKADVIDSVYSDRLGFARLSDEEKDTIHMNPIRSAAFKAERLEKYKEELGYDDGQAEEEYEKDYDALMVSSTDSSFEGYVKSIEDEAEEVQEKTSDVLRDTRRRIGGLVLGMERAAKPHLYEYSRAGEKESEAKKEKDIQDRTEGKDFLVVSELLKGMEGKDSASAVGAMRILTKNNDFNEVMKDKRVVKMLTKPNGLFSKMAKKGEFSKDGEAMSDADIETMIKDFKENPVTPAYVQAAVRGMLGEIGMSDKKAARTASELGALSFASGQNLTYAMSDGNVNTGEFEFEDLTFKDGSLHTSENRKGALVGKMNNLESQAKIKMIHPDLIISEALDGSGAGIHKDGEQFLASITDNDMTQIKRLRGDVIVKIASSRKVLENAKDLVQRLEDAGEETKAKRVKTFIGYCKMKYEGTSEPPKDMEGAGESFDEI